jgi:hypothetical protein
MQTIRKYIIYQYVPVMKNILKSGTTESCVAQRSIYVILRGNEETRSYINEFIIIRIYFFFGYYATYRTGLAYILVAD